MNEILTPENVKLKGDRYLGISPSETIRPFDEVFKNMQEAGVGLVELNLEWSYFEPLRGQYQDPSGLLDAVGFYGLNGIKIGLSIATINTVRRTDPLELIDLPYDHPERINAFNALVDWVLLRIDGKVEVDYISVGNEIDFLLTESEWPTFDTFLQQTKAHIQSTHPNIKVGAKITLTEGLLTEKQDLALELIESSDVAMLNYYPQNEEFEVLTWVEAKQGFELALALVEKPVYFTEIGYQSGSKYCKSSEIAQATFYHQLFKYWDLRRDQVKYVNLVWMDDVTETELSFFESYYGYSDPAFLEYLATLGLHDNTGRPKRAWDQILAETSIRGW